MWCYVAILSLICAQVFYMLFFADADEIDPDSSHKERSDNEIPTDDHIVQPNVTIVTYGSSAPIYLAALSYVAPAIEVAIEYVKRLYGFQIRHVIRSRPDIILCQDLVSNTDLIAKYYYNEWDGKSLFVVIYAAGCQDIFNLAMLSREWNTLLISSGVAFSELRDKEHYPTVIQIGSQPQFGIFSQTFLAICAHFNWTTASVIYDTSEQNPFFKLFSTALGDTVQKNPASFTSVALRRFPVSSTDVKLPYNATLSQAKLHSRIIILAIHPNHTRKFMVSGARSGMKTGDYVYFTIEPFENARRFGKLTWKTDDEDEKVALDSFRFLFQITGSSCSRVSSELDFFVRVLNDIKVRSMEKYNVTFSPNEQPSDVAVSTFYGVQILARILKDKSRLKNPSNDGLSLASEFWNRTFKFKSGNMYINEFGERMVEPCIKSLNTISSSFEPFMQYDPHLQILRIFPELSIRWSGPDNKPPPSTPVSTVDKSLQWSNFWPVTIAVSFLSVVLVVFFAVTLWWNRKGPLPRGQWWRITRNQLLPITDSEYTLITSVNNSTKFFPKSAWGRASSAGVFHFQDRLVRSRRISASTNFPPNDEALRCLWELKTIKSDNLTTLYGVCNGCDELLFVYEFCEKGDLMSLLGSSYPDQDFKVSWICDLIEGMAVIHKSSFKRHGFLNPYVCLIGKRFILKITDFGIYDIGRYMASQWEDVDRNLEMNIDAWVAPEFKTFPYVTYNLLTLAENGGPEADIYSFGGIIAKLFRKSEAWAASILSPKHADRWPFFEKLTTQCQNAIPSQRPDICWVKALVMDFVGADFTSHIVDNMLRKMGSYASELEMTVVTHTNALKFERQVRERLLAAMLPDIITDLFPIDSDEHATTVNNVTIIWCSFIDNMDTTKNQSIPHQFFECINEIYTMFDDIVNRTTTTLSIEAPIGSYLVACGLLNECPVGNAVEGCLLSLQFRAAFSRLTISSNVSLQLKTGIDTGSCVAGVVGTKRPQYCL